MGNKTVKVTSNTVSSGREGSSGHRSRNQSCQSRALMAPSDIHTLPKEKVILLKEGLHSIVANRM